MSYTGCGLGKRISFRRLCKIAKSNYQPRHICLSVRPSFRPDVSMEQLGSQLTDFQVIFI
jgi:hypothetical protein